MTVKCVHCGNEISIEESIGDCRLVECPFCGGELELDKPTRIELPDCRLGRNNREQQQSMPTKRKLAVIRPIEQPTQVHPVMPPLQPRIAQDSSVKRQKSCNGGSIIGYLAIIAVAAFAIVGIMLLRHYLSAEERRQAELVRVQELERRDEESRRRLAQEEETRNRREELRKAEEERNRAKEEAERTRREERQKAEAERKRILDEERRKQEDVRREKADISRQRREMLGQVRTVRIDYLRNCPKDERPQSVKEQRTYACIVPKVDRRADVYHIVAVPGEELHIEQYDEESGRRTVLPDEFRNQIEYSPCLFMSNGKGWICGERKCTKGIPVVNLSSSINPAQEELGFLYEYLQSYSVRIPAIVYNVYFEDKQGKRELIRRIGFGETVSAYNAKPIVCKILQDRSRNRGHGFSQNRRNDETQTLVSDVEVVNHLTSGRLWYASAQEKEAQEIGGSSGDDAEKVKEMKQEMEGNLQEIRRLRLENPACEWNQDSFKNIRNIVMRRITREQRRYYDLKEVTYVRKHFYCTGCDIEHDGYSCRSSRTSHPSWLQAKENIAITMEFNKKIDALLERNEALKCSILKADSAQRSRR